MRNFILRKGNILIISFVFTVLLSEGQTSSCYFLRDTGTVKVETSASMVELSDGSIYVTGTQGNGPHGNDDVALLKLDACGKVLWIKYYGDSLSNDGLFINKTSKEKLIIVGQTGTLTNKSDIFLYILDTSGAILLKKLYGDSLDQMAKYVEQTSDKGFVFGGYTSDPYGSNDDYVVKVDSLGIEQWHLQNGGPSVEYVDQVHELSDGNFLITGDTKSYGNGATDVEVIKCNKNGKIIWDKYYGDRLNNGCQGILELSNKKYISFGETQVSGSIVFDFFIEMIDTSGAIISRHTFGGTGADALFYLTELPGMEFICTGYSNSYNGSSATDVVIFKVDTMGKMKWLKNISNPGIDIGYKIIPSIQGGYLVTGLFATNNDDYFLTLSDTIGNTTVGIPTFIEEDKVLAYPNPFVSNVLISINNNSIENIAIFDLLGKKHIEIVTNSVISNQSVNLDLSQLTSGPYFAHIRTHKGMVIRKIFKE